MIDDGSKKLGRGLSALLGAESADYASLDRVRLSKMVPIEQLQPGPFQPRRLFGDEELAALAESIKANGILQPILVRRRPQQPNAYEIVAGERRWRAAQRAQLHEVPVIIRDLADREALELALVENLQRENLSALEEAEGYRRLLEEFKNTQEDLAQHVGKSRSHIANMLRLLGLPSQVKALLDEGQLTAGHARVLVTAADPVGLAKQIVAQGLNVRQAERMASAAKPTASRKSARSKPGAAVRDADTLALERDLSNLLGLKVSINFDGQGSGALTIHYKSLDQLDDLLQRLTRAAGAAAKPAED
ncbi:chromosome partitioning protein ParB [Hypericibacter terrae]|uniref:Chromosome partitioning protein ParB n=1 Tax=Hypericibacter terrae TaxID=2602015 RepID=A0A5J6MQX1_9PROT|nr:ParB/RepB/Spo0J family partition protein [Hypericibacter terrae]QEX19898.1 chromosome partitioning protein ParB [Hypericibacter terrae]